SRMKPSSFRTRARLVLVLVNGISTEGRSIRLAFRMRVSISAIGSVIMVGRPPFSPAGFLDAWNQPITGHPAEADTADAEFAIHGTGAAAEAATLTDANQLAWFH